MTFAIPEAALQDHIAILGKTGAGKTSTAKLIVEHVASGRHLHRVCVLDPIKSDWWGLTSSADGKHEGLPFHILGGPRGHVPLHAGAGKAIAEIVANGELPLSIIDMSDFGMGGQQNFFTDFAPTLLRKMRGVLYLVVEEAHVFAPKEKSMREENMSTHWAKMLATAGRTKGVRLVVCTQRTQALHNAVLGSCETMVAHRLRAPADQAPVRNWLKNNVDKELAKQVEDSLSSLPTGSAWVCAGEAQFFKLVQFPRITTYDNTKTPTSDVRSVNVKTAPVDQEKLRAIIGEAIAEAEANDPKKLKAELVKVKVENDKLKRQNVKPEPLLANKEEMDRAHALGDLEGFERGWRLGWKAGHVTGCEAQMKELERASLAFTPDAPAPPNAPAKTSGFPKPAAQDKRIAQRAPAKEPPRSVANQTNGALTKPQQRMLDAIAFWNATGEPLPTVEQVASVCGYSFKASTRRVVAGALASAGLIHYPTNGRMALTDAGVVQACSMTAEEAASQLRSVITAPQMRVVDLLLADGDGMMDKDALIESAGYSKAASTYRVVLGALSTLRVIHYPTKGVVALNGWVREVLQ